MGSKKEGSPSKNIISDEKDDSKKYPIEANGVELMLGGMFSAIALVSPRKGLNLYETPAKYLSVSATILFVYYALLTFADIYCFRAPANRQRRSKSIKDRLGAVLKMALATLASGVAISLVLVLFGAPALSQHMETFTAAVNVAFLSVTPAILLLKPEVNAWRKALLAVSPKTVPEKWASGMFWCTMCVSWAAAYFIPMDWDRPWQKWPIPIVMGAFLGNLVGLLFVTIRCLVIPLARADFLETERIKREMIRQPVSNRSTQSDDEPKKQK
ncbi:hypothetical protein LPJ64_000874 [Coemansia asiatica]|uniref:Phosphatidylinositol-glycan biosynthesis class F protein n=1 Tax=Coemansia asiatica TaxID=1052880 RepID=A0A9W7XR13_9FUNG|nr:hypothetical protein LPJ64_000874 [Coemansia asiatica]